MYQLIIVFKTGVEDDTEYATLTELRKYLEEQDNVDRYRIVAQDGSTMEEG